MFILLDVDPVLAGFGQTAAIIICLFLSISILLTVAFALVMVFATSWVREKSELIKMLRPSVDSVNETTGAALQGQSADDEDKNAIIRTIAKVPAGVHATDKKVEQVTDKVAQGAIEFRARMIQAQTVAKAFLFPKATARHGERPAVEDGLEFDSPGYRALMKEKALSTAPVSDVGNGYTKSVGASKLKDVSVR